MWSFSVKRVEAKRQGNPPKYAALGVGTWMTPRNMILPKVLDTGDPPLCDGA